MGSQTEAVKLWSCSTGEEIGAQIDEKGWICIQLWHHQTAFAQVTCTFPALFPEETLFLHRRGGTNPSVIEEQCEISHALTLLTSSSTFLSSSTNILKLYRGMKQKPSTLNMLSMNNWADSQALGWDLPPQATKTRQASVWELSAVRE